VAELLARSMRQTAFAPLATTTTLRGAAAQRQIAMLPTSGRESL
jgi:hypothetical protein